MASGSKKVIFAALAGNAAIAVTKFAASLYTGSSAMMTEALHSLIDTFNQVLLLWGLRQGAKPPSEDFPFGHGKEVYFWSFVVSILIFAVGAGISLYEGIHRIVDPNEVSNVYVNYAVLGAAMIFEGGALTFALREFNKARGELGILEAVRRGKDPSMFVVVFEDSAAMAGLVFAFLGVLLGQLTGSPLFDGIASVMIGLVLAATSIFLAYETKGLLIGEAARPDLVASISALTITKPEIDSINECLTMHMGPEYVLVCMSVDFSPDCSADEVEAMVTTLTRAIKESEPEVKRVFIEAEGWSRRTSALHAIAPPSSA